MSKVVVLAEKPSVARDLAKVLRCTKKGNGFLEGDKYIVTWALGHLVTLADPEVYDDRYKTWKLEDLPLLFAALKLVVIRQTSKQFNAVKTQLNRKDVQEIIIATDAGREGELVARWILEKANVRKPLKRLWISSVTDKAIQAGFSNLRPGKAYDNLFASAVARAQADWFIGINASRALTCKYNAQLSCGRVQTPTLAIIAQREEEIKNFRPREYYGLTALTEVGLKLVWQDQKTKDIKTFDGEKCTQLFKSLQHQQAKVTKLNKSYKKSYAPLLYDLTELQRDANRMFGYSAKETLSIMQRLYEQHKVLTYPRTDSRYISSDLVDTLKERVEACNIGPYTALASKVLSQGLKVNRQVVDNNKVTDHHAIIPTEQKVSLRALSDKERRIYELVVKRFLANFFQPFEYEQTTINCSLGNEMFIAKGKVVVHSGWKEIYAHSADEEGVEDLANQEIPKLAEGDALPLTKLIKTEGQTKPPPRFNEASLLSAMENPVKYMTGESKDLIKTISQTGGLGTVATRADIIERLFNSFLIEKRGQEIAITSKGKQLLELVPEDLKSPALTAEWEQKLEAIAHGSLQAEQFLTDIKAYTQTIIREIKNSTHTFKHDNLTGTKCPECGKPMLEVKGKKGTLLVCQDRECGHKKHVSQETNARCPNCRKKLLLEGEGEGQIFVCKCGYKEKLSAFQERRKKEKHSRASNKEINNYLRKQEIDNQEPFNPALAEALAKLKLGRE